MGGLPFNGRGFEEDGERGQQFGRGPAEFLPVDDGEFPKDPLSLRSDADPDFPVVLGVAAAGRESQPDEPVGQLDDAVVAKLELPGEGADGGGRPLREAPDGQEELVLLGLEARPPRGLLAEREEPPDQMPEPGQRAVVRVAKVAGLRSHSRL
jgi:hypothetical protein